MGAISCNVFPGKKWAEPPPPPTKTKPVWVYSRLCGSVSHRENWNPRTINHDEYRGMSANFRAVAFTSINSVCIRENVYIAASLG